MHAARLFFRLIVRPLLREPLRALLTALAAALGVAVVAAIDLAAESSTGSFRSSLETLSGEAVYEISAVGGVPERVHGDLVRLPYPGRFAARLEDYALVGPRRERVPFFGVDLFGDPVAGAAAAAFRENLGERLAEPGVLAGAALAMSKATRLKSLSTTARTRLRVAGRAEPQRSADGRPRPLPGDGYRACPAPLGPPREDRPDLRLRCARKRGVAAGGSRRSA